MLRKPRKVHYETTKQGIADFFDVAERTVRTWKYLEDAAFELENGDKAYNLAIIARARHNKIQNAQSSRRVAKEAGSAVTYSDKKDREQAWKMRYERLLTQDKMLAKTRVQESLRRWAMAFPGPLKEFVAFVVSMVPGPQKAIVKKQGMEAIMQCMEKIRDLATAYGTDVPEEVIVKPKRRKRVSK